jgi:hypothetical protein
LRRISRETLFRVRDEMASYPWGDDEIAELVAPKLGIISGLADLLAQLEDLRRVDLGTTPPASDIPPGGS